MRHFNIAKLVMWSTIGLVSGRACYVFIMTEKELRMGPVIQPGSKLDCRCLALAAVLQL